MSLKKIALVALIVVMLFSSVIAFGCKKKAPETTTDTTMVAPTDTTAMPVDTTAAPTETAPVTK
ncbi:MAG: hypothetical protein ACE14O_02575 [Candidatus Cloacimonadaceae bacterium]